MSAKDSYGEMEFHININEVSKLFNTTKATLRYYDSIGLISLKRNQENDYREFNRLSVIQIMDVLTLRQLGIPIREIQEIFRSPVEDVIQKLDALYEKVELEIQDLRRINLEMKESAELMKKYLQLKNGEYAFKKNVDFQHIIPWRLRDPKSLKQFLRHPYSTQYTVIFNAEDTGVFREGLCVNDLEPDELPLWSAAACRNRFVECLTETKQAYPNENNLEEHIGSLHRQGYSIGIIIAKYLASDFSPGKKEKKDFYQTFIEIKDR